ncbi:hypothetical protein [Teredinibacter sp. KSP-S5-2]|uniref:hypothetical protein n=1 Tax=Teredinibacter sp. KSP-S5-2 TaxID=3034506 RepID=UPI0029349743|nr:hypothetical protein [Teredinibacter sp. KSP-S5-2]WNO11297.1 hypothetical protein P5V12_08945 [Teredinibacter sp. KSP-S5-2]
MSTTLCLEKKGVVAIHNGDFGKSFAEYLIQNDVDLTSFCINQLEEALTQNIDYAIVIVDYIDSSSIGLVEKSLKKKGVQWTLVWMDGYRCQVGPVFGFNGEATFDCFDRRFLCNPIDGRNIEYELAIRNYHKKKCDQRPDTYKSPSIYALIKGKLMQHIASPREYAGSYVSIDCLNMFYLKRLVVPLHGVVESRRDTVTRIKAALA